MKARAVRTAVAVLALTGCGGTASPEGASYGTELGTVDADEDGRIDVTVRNPDDVPVGPASLRVGPEASPIVVTDP
jgi:dUTPase